MKKSFCIPFVALALSLLSGCSGSGSSADPPALFAATEGDGRVVLTWTASPEVNYWLFTATDPSLTAFVWTSLPNAHVYMGAVSPFYMCGLLNGTQYYFAANGRTGGGPGGPSSPTISPATPPYNTGSSWNANTSVTSNYYGVGYVGLKTCSNISTSAAGDFAVVGASGVIATSTDDGANWTPQASPTTTELYAVTGYAANQNSATNPALRWVAVGDGGAAVYSTDGALWAVGRAHDVSNPTLRSITHIAGTFLAVGDAGTILSTTNGTSWTTRNSDSTYSLYGVTHGGIYVAVGSSGKILTSADGVTWTTQTSGTSNILRQVSSIGNTYVAVGDGGMIVTSVDSGITWTTQTITGSPNLVGIAANAQHATLNSSGTPFTTTELTANSQFVAVDSSGNAYTSADGLAWSSAIATGAANLNALVSSGFGYVAAGSGVTATSF